jgi:hypothetical protein
MLTQNAFVNNILLVDGQLLIVSTSKYSSMAEHVNFVNLCSSVVVL